MMRKGIVNGEEFSRKGAKEQRCKEICLMSFPVSALLVAGKPLLIAYSKIILGVFAP
jgi:hypothetical protein